MLSAQIPMMLQIVNFLLFLISQKVVIHTLRLQVIQKVHQQRLSNLNNLVLQMQQNNLNYHQQHQLRLQNQHKSLI